MVINRTSRGWTPGYIFFSSLVLSLSLARALSLSLSYIFHIKCSTALNVLIIYKLLSLVRSVRRQFSKTLRHTFASVKTNVTLLRKILFYSPKPFFTFPVSFHFVRGYIVIVYRANESKGDFLDPPPLPICSMTWLVSRRYKIRIKFRLLQRWNVTL